MPKTRKAGDEGIIKRMYKKEYKQIIKDNNVEAVGKTLIKEMCSMTGVSCYILDEI